MTNFIRKVEVVIGPLSEAQGGGSRNDGVVITSTGMDNEYRIQFYVTKTVTGAPNSVKFRVTNLPQSIRSRIKASFTMVKLFAGWVDDVDLPLVGQGAIMAAVSDRDGPSIITGVNALDGYEGMYTGVFRKTYSAGVPVEKVLRDAAVSVSNGGIGVIDVEGATGFKGLASSGRTVDFLDRLADQHGFSWSIQDGKFQAITDTRPINRIFEISGKAGNLISASPILSGPAQAQSGVEVKAVLDTRVQPGAQIRLDSTINPGLNGTYPVHAIEFQGDTHGQEWTMTIKSFFIQ